MNMRISKMFGVAAVVGGFGVSAANGALLVTEFLADPTGTDADREWIEIFNSGSEAIDLTGYKVGDEENLPGNAGAHDEGMFQFPSGATIQPNQVVTIAVKATGYFALYQKLPDYETSADTDATVPNMTKYSVWGTGDIALNNTGDHALIVGPDDTIVDGVSYGNVTAFGSMIAPAPNQSYERVNPGVDTNSPSDWALNPVGSATPGVVAIPEPAAVSLLALPGVMLLGRRRRA